jgi:hypothetical protein
MSLTFKWLCRNRYIRLHYWLLVCLAASHMCVGRRWLSRMSGNTWQSNGLSAYALWVTAPSCVASCGQIAFLTLLCGMRRVLYLSLRHPGPNVRIKAL